jgi:hypothetical protein
MLGARFEIWRDGLSYGSKSPAPCIHLLEDYREQAKTRTINIIDRQLGISILVTRRNQVS